MHRRVAVSPRAEHRAAGVPGPAAAPHRAEPVGSGRVRERGVAPREAAAQREMAARRKAAAWPEAAAPREAAARQGARIPTRVWREQVRMPTLSTPGKAM